VTVHITFARSADERAEIFRFRYSIYVEEMKRPQRYADHHARQIEDPLDTFGHLLMATVNGVLVGTLRTNFLRDGNIGEYATLYGIAGQSPAERSVTSVTARLMIVPEYRSGTLAVRLARAVYEFGLASNIESDYLDCNPPLEPFFRRLGHLPVRTPRHPEYGDVTVIHLRLRDESHLRTIGSPLLRTRPPHLFPDQVSR
jgi:N-acyl-L-homoserine lactone synthetase